jgi:hypothetical protein
MATRQLKLFTLLAASAAVLACLPGCIVGAAVGGMMESAHRTGSHEVDAEYLGIAGKSFTVVCTADRLIQSDQPGLVARVIQRTNDRIIQNALPSHAIPSADLLTVLYNTPHWPAMTRGEVATLLEVQVLIVVEIIDYRLHEPGNQYIWDGSASCLVSVYESESGLPDDPVFEQAIRVSFPDSTGYMRTEIPESAVTTELSNRLINRVAWLFYNHEESNVIPY